MITAAKLEAALTARQQAAAKKESRYRMVRVPAALADRLDRIADELLTAYEEGRTERVQITEQGSRGAWVSLPEVIRIALDEYEDHRERSRRSSRKSRKTETTVETTTTPEAA